MDKPRHLDGTGKGEFYYDYKYDTLIFKIKGRDYKTSLEFQNFVIDIDTENYIMGIRIFDVSKVTGLDKIIFKNLVHGEFNASIKDNIITIRFTFIGKKRNILIPLTSNERFTQQFTVPGSSKHPIEDATVTVPEIVS
jgi:uncharacterized protein YuzE